MSIEPRLWEAFIIYECREHNILDVNPGVCIECEKPLVETKYIELEAFQWAIGQRDELRVTQTILIKSLKEILRTYLEILDPWKALGTIVDIVLKAIKKNHG